MRNVLNVPPLSMKTANAALHDQIELHDLRAIDCGLPANERKQKSNNPKFSTRPLGLWLEISGCDKLFKGYNNLLQALAKKLQDQSISRV